MPGDNYYLIVASGFLLCLFMIPISLIVLNWSAWIFIFGTLVFFAFGVFSPSAEEEEPGRGTEGYRVLESRDQREAYEDMLIRYMK